MAPKEAVLTKNAPAPMPFFSQAIKCNGMVYCSGSIGMSPETNKMLEGTVGDRAVSVFFSSVFYLRVGICVCTDRVN